MSDSEAKKPTEQEQATPAAEKDSWAKVFEPLDFLAKVTALIPQPGRNLLRYHDQFAPQGRWRSQIVIGKPTEPSRSAHAGAAQSGEAKRRRRTWAELLKRTFAIDVLTCGKCGGRREVIAVIDERKTVKRILDHLGIPSAPPRLQPARGPPSGRREDTVWA